VERSFSLLRSFSARVFFKKVTVATERDVVAHGVCRDCAARRLRGMPIAEIKSRAAGTDRSPPRCPTH
jgi:hypothetical protein